MTPWCKLGHWRRSQRFRNKRNNKLGVASKSIIMHNQNLSAMMKTVAGILLTFVILSSCKKSSTSTSSGGGTITATIDGTQMTFNTILIVKDTAFMGAYALTMSGATSASSSATELSLTVDGTSPITTGTYNFGPSGTTTDLPALAYSQGSSLLYEEDITGAHENSIVITSLSKTNVQGTFSGTLTLMLGSGPQTKTVTNGKFNVNFK